MIISIERKKQEALRRMGKIGIAKEATDKFDEEGMALVSMPSGTFIDLNEEQKSSIAGLESEYNALVYHVIHSDTEYGVMDTYLYVSDDEEEWEEDDADLEEQMQFCFVRNLDTPDLPEFGSAGFEVSPTHSLIRVW